MFINPIMLDPDFAEHPHWTPVKISRGGRPELAPLNMANSPIAPLQVYRRDAQVPTKLTWFMGQYTEEYNLSIECQWTIDRQLTMTLLPVFSPEEQERGHTYMDLHGSPTEPGHPSWAVKTAHFVKLSSYMSTNEHDPACLKASLREFGIDDTLTCVYLHTGRANHAYRAQCEQEVTLRDIFSVAPDLSLRLHEPRWDNDDRCFTAYITLDDYIRDRRHPIKTGKLIRLLRPGASDNLVKAVVNKFNNTFGELTYKQDNSLSWYRHVYRLTALGSCMAKDEDHFSDLPKGCLPTDAYHYHNDIALRVFYCNDAPIARVLLNTQTRRYPSMYTSDAGNTRRYDIVALLKSEGYRQCDRALVDQPLQKILTDDGDLVLPYIDKSNLVVAEYENHLVITPTPAGNSPKTDMTLPEPTLAQHEEAQGFWFARYATGLGELIRIRGHESTARNVLIELRSLRQQAEEQGLDPDGMIRLDALLADEMACHFTHLNDLDHPDAYSIVHAQDPSGEVTPCLVENAAHDIYQIYDSVDLYTESALSAHDMVILSDTWYDYTTACPEDQTVTTVDDHIIREEDARQLHNGDYMHKDDDDLHYLDHEDDYYHNNELVYSHYYSEYIPEDDAVWSEHHGTYIRCEDAVKTPDNRYYHEDDLEEAA